MLVTKICRKVTCFTDLEMIGTLMIICTENPLPIGGFLAYFHR